MKKTKDKTTRRGTQMPPPAAPRDGDLPGLIVAGTPLGTATQSFRDQCDVIDAAKDQRDAIGVRVITEMKKVSRRIIRIEHHGRRYTFEIRAGNEKLVCKEEKAA